MRDLCGLFVSVIDSKIYLLHQTARDFLVPEQADYQDDSDDSYGDSDDDFEDVPKSGPKSAPQRDPRQSSQDGSEHDSGNRLKWKYSLDPRESHRILCQLCIWHLLFAEFETHPLAPVEDIGPLIQYLDEHIFLDYSAKNWAAHFRLSDFQDEDDISLLRICDAESERCQTWFQVYWASTRPGEIGFPGGFTTLMVASYSGIGRVVKLVLEKDGLDINSKDKAYGRTALSWAAEKGFTDIVDLLIRGPKIGLKHVMRRSARKSVRVNAEDVYGRAPISYASWNGHRAVVKRLLKAGAHATYRDKFGGSPMAYAVANGDKKMCMLLEDNGEKTLRFALVEVFGAMYELLVDDTLEQEKLRASRLFPKRWDFSFDDNDMHLDMPERRQELLVSAAKWGQEEMARRLLERGADIHRPKKSGETALSAAIKGGQLAMVKLLIEKGADIEARDSLGRTSLFLVAEGGGGHEEIAKFLLEKGMDVNARDNTGSTALYWAAFYGDEAIARLLLENGADIEARGEAGFTPLLVAANVQYQEVFECLLEEATSEAKRDKASLFSAAMSKNEAVVKLLVEKGANIEAKCDHGTTALWLAACASKDVIVKLLLEKGADVDARDEKGDTPLGIASWLHDRDLVRTTSGKIKERWDQRHLLQAARSRNEAVIRLLVEGGADIEAADGVENRTPLWLAAANGKESVVKFLLDKGAKMEGCGENMETPLEAAAREGHSPIVKLLKRRCREVSQ